MPLSSLVSPGLWQTLITMKPVWCAQKQHGLEIVQCRWSPLYFRTVSLWISMPNNLSFLFCFFPPVIWNDNFKHWQEPRCFGTNALILPPLSALDAFSWRKSHDVKSLHISSTELSRLHSGKWVHWCDYPHILRVLLVAAQPWLFDCINELLAIRSWVSASGNWTFSLDSNKRLAVPLFDSLKWIRTKPYGFRLWCVGIWWNKNNTPPLPPSQHHHPLIPLCLWFCCQ